MGNFCPHHTPQLHKNYIIYIKLCEFGPCLSHKSVISANAGDF